MKRISFDIPDDLHSEIKSLSKKNSISIKEFFLRSVLKEKRISLARGMKEDSFEVFDSVEEFMNDFKN